MLERAEIVARIDAAFEQADQAWEAPAKLSLSDWAEANFVLSPETAAEPGRWRTLPYQRGILDAITDPNVTHVTLKKSARIGYTLCISAAMGYFMDHEPSTMLVVQPTVDDAKGFSKDTIAPMLRDVPALSKIVFKDREERGREASDTLTHKSFTGGVLSLAGANAATGLRRISRRVVFFDEVDAYPASAGRDGDPIALGMKRSEYFWNRKIVAGSTPLIDGASRIDEMFEAGDRRRFYVPCPHCEHMDFLRFSFRDDEHLEGGHVMAWDKDELGKPLPTTAHLICSDCGCQIDEEHKLEMLEKGEWRAEVEEFAGHASFHIWAAYSLSPNATWAQIVAEFAAADTPEKLQAFVNTTLGQTWKERGEAPEWKRLHDRREGYTNVPRGVVVLTAGVDVQKDRFVFEVVGWAPNLESWTIEAGEIHGDTEKPETWDLLDGLLTRTYVGEEGETWTVARLGIDSGYRTQLAYAYARRHPELVMATKGVAGSRMLVGVATAVDVTINGRRFSRGVKMWPLGVDVAKGELYAFLALERGDDGVHPRGFCHFPELPEEYFRQLTAEQLITRLDRRTRRAERVWVVQPNRQNHFLDCRVIARAAAAVLGIERMPPKDEASPPSASAPNATTDDSQSSGSWGMRPRGWLGGRRR